MVLGAYKHKHTPATSVKLIAGALAAPGLGPERGWVRKP